MKFWLFGDITAILLLPAISAVYLPQLPQKHGSLYEGLQTLISIEKENAQQIWNDTQYQINENSAILQTALDYMHNYEAILNDKIDQINSLERSEELRKCYKQYERQIARFNRDLLHKYFICKQALNSSLSQLQSEIVTEIQYIHDAPFEIQELMYDCNITDLKRVGNEPNHAPITLCVVSKLAEINQHIFQASQICLDIIARMSINEGNHENDEMEEMPGSISNNSCLDFQYIRDEFEAIYADVMLCAREVN